MNNVELEAVRKRLFFTQTDAAALIGHVSDRSWRKWESGVVPVPPDVVTFLQYLQTWRENALATMRSVIADARTRMPSVSISLVWYESSDDWMTLPNREAVIWKPHCSVLAEIYAIEQGIRLVRFDAPAYRAWFGDRPDNELSRSQWAAEQP